MATAFGGDGGDDTGDGWSLDVASGRVRFAVFLIRLFSRPSTVGKTSDISVDDGVGGVVHVDGRMSVNE
jgi:hypothetical protein